jgi:hypothetical protein
MFMAHSVDPRPTALSALYVDAEREGSGRGGWGGGEGTGEHGRYVLKLDEP